MIQPRSFCSPRLSDFGLVSRAALALALFQAMSRTDGVLEYVAAVAAATAVLVATVPYVPALAAAAVVDATAPALLGDSGLIVAFATQCIVLLAVFAFEPSLAGLFFAATLPGPGPAHITFGPSGAGELLSTRSRLWESRWRRTHLPSE